MVYPELSVGPFLITQPNPTHVLSNPTQPNPLISVNYVTQPNPTHKYPTQPNPTQHSSPIIQPDPTQPATSFYIIIFIDLLYTYYI